MNNTGIDITARRKSAALFRHFAAGQLTNYQLEESQPESFELGLNAIFFYGIWPLYDDLHEHKLTGRHRLTPEDRDHIARIILFLHTSLPYRWPVGTGWRGIADWLVTFLTLGIYRPMRRRIRESGGDKSVWPFFTRAEYDSALQHPPFLHATKCA
jgi:hypothetical protein